MALFAKRGHVNSGCCGDEAHQARKSDHNADESGYAHAQDVHERVDHDMQPYVDYIMRNPAKFKQIKYLIYEGHIYYPNPGARPAGKYTYTGPNAHAAHLHISIHAGTHFYAGSWYVDEAYGQPSEEDEMTPEQDKRLREVEAYVVHFQEFFNDLDGRVNRIVSAVERVQSTGASGGSVDVAAIADAVVDELARRAAE